MDVQQVLEKLAAAGSAQTRKTYIRHGVRGEQFGVSYAELKKLVKQLKTNQPLAEQLWDSENHDARILATMIADPAKISLQVLTRWAKTLDCHPLCDAYSGVAARSPRASRLFSKWRDSTNECLAIVAWNIVARLALEPELANAVGWNDDVFSELLNSIEQEIHERPNRVRYSMNNTLIAIALRSVKLQKRGLQAARRIGTVEVDHGDTSCKTPSAVEYIEKAVAHRQQASAKAASKTAARDRTKATKK